VKVKTTVSAPIAPGRHRVRIRGTGPDWFLVGAFRVSNYAAALRAVARGTTTNVVAWVVNQAAIDYPPLPDPKTHVAPAPGPRPPAASGTLVIPGLAPALYRVSWWDTREGMESAAAEVRHSGGDLRLATPPVASDVAVWVRAATVASPDFPTRPSLP
jgi:hypothetical protein